MTRDDAQIEETSPQSVARPCIDAGVDAAHPATVVSNTISLADDDLEINGTTYDLTSYQDILVLGGGNAAGKVAAALESILDDRLTDGVVVTDVPESMTKVDIVAGSHPVPNERGVTGAKRILERATEATGDTLILGVITGGGSALLPAPTDDVTLADLRTVTDDLIGTGATIHEINAVRKHLSAIKGGQLAKAAAPATVVGLLLSDVVGDDLDVIASGPLVPDASTYADALDVTEQHDVTLPSRAEHHLKRGAEGNIAETPKPGADVFESVKSHILANGLTALRAAADTADDHGYTPLILSSRVRGEARQAAKTHVGIAEEIDATGTPISSPAVVLSGGETTVMLSTGTGAGGPNQEFALSAALELETDSIVVGSVDTDGIDGASNVAGAITDVEIVNGVRKEAQAALDSNKSASFLETADALVKIGPTGTNVNDLRVLVVNESETTN